jgi:hypothetical protein
MTDARNALAEIKRGRMNESARIARMQRRGSSVGSVAGGGILRELTTRTTVASPVVQPVLAKDPEEPLPSGRMSNCRWAPPSDWECK